MLTVFCLMKSLLSREQKIELGHMIKLSRAKSNTTGPCFKQFTEGEYVLIYFGTNLGVYMIEILAIETGLQQVD